ncbi:Protein CBG26200 [Caenorhabditis briggsae]|uniref:Protein CBG26200 n=1 Tax=Caenorhabditis briggsae TaxID=6238 RepID=B6ILU5_CAEBR|nr:Protein CBG26200 [Caenorhabditis briggsae]CAS00875.1 Protein CBG26200 [Caenorhabditis briggsae]
MEQHIVMENDMVIAGEVVIGADEEVNELHLQLREKNQEIANLKDENEQLTVEKNTEENWKNYWFGAFNREKNRADGLQLEKDQAGFGLAVPVADLKEYLFHPDSRHQVPQIVRRVPIKIRQLFFIKNRGRDSFRSLTD